MKYLSICSGIEAATVAWRPMGWTAAGFAEIEKFPSSVLAHHYPGVRNFGDFTTIGAGDVGAIDLLVGGTPCQDFSVAGLRAGMDGARGQLTIEFARLAERLRPRWLVWENVPGVLSIDGGRAFGTFLGLLGKLGYGFAYRVLDAQFFGVPQRRRRVFVVGYFGDWRRAAAVLFERHSLSGYPPPRRETGKGLAPTISARTKGGGGLGTDFDCDGGLIAFGGSANCKQTDVSTAVIAHPGGYRLDFETETFIAHSLRADGFDASEDGTGRGTPLVPMCFSAKDHGSDAMEDVSPTLRAGGHTSSHANAGVMPAVAIPGDDYADAYEADASSVLSTLRKKAGKEATAEWGFRVLVSLQSEEVLQRWLHGESLRCASESFRHWVDDRTLPREEGSAASTLRKVWQEGPDGRSPQGRGLSKQLIHQLSEAVSKLSHEGTSTDSEMRDLWRQSEGLRLLQQALSTVQSRKAERNTPGAVMAVRRLTPVECERLMGFPDDYTKITDKTADGPRYKALGNSMAVPVMAWIGQRMQSVSDSQGVGE